MIDNKTFISCYDFLHSKDFSKAPKAMELLCIIDSSMRDDWFRARLDTNIRDKLVKQILSRLEEGVKKKANV